MKTSQKNSGGRRKPYEPTAKDIRRACERIQGTWSARERGKRSGLSKLDSWLPPRVDWSTVTDAITESQSDVPVVNSRSDGGW